MLNLLLLSHAMHAKNSARTCQTDGVKCCGAVERANVKIKLFATSSERRGFNATGDHVHDVGGPLIVQPLVRGTVDAVGDEL